MVTAHSRQIGAERLIATGRVMLATLSLVAIWGDPSASSHYAQTVGAVLGGYTLGAVLLAAVLWASPTPLVGVVGLLSHVGDLGIFTLFMYFPEGFTSPFFLYLLFALLSATLRWRWRGTFWTTVAALGVLVGLGTYEARVLHASSFEMSRLIIRSTYLLVMAGLLGYLAAYEDRLRGETSKLAGWPGAVPEDARALVSDTLSRVADILQAPRVLLAWSEPEEPWLYLAMWDGEGLHWTREAPDACQPLVAEALAESDFFCSEGGARAPEVFFRNPAGVQRWRGAPLHPELQARVGVGSILSVSLERESVDGRLFVLDKPDLTLDDLTVGALVGRQLAARLNRFYLAQRLQQVAVVEERVRLARDLHDGLLQSLTGVALQLQATRRIVEAEPQVARARLHDVQRVIAAEQADLRVFVQQLRPTALGKLPTDSSLPARVDQLGERIAQQWGVQVEIKTRHLDAPLPEPLTRQIYRIVQEALVNAARHADASAIRVEIAVQDDQARISVMDNGRGFPFRGHYDLAALTASRQGPATLKERIAELRGQLTIDSTDSGAELQITLPLDPPVA